MENTAFKPAKVIVKCKNCGWRIFDKITPATGVIEVKCQRCGKVSTIDLSLRRAVKYRLAPNRLSKPYYDEGRKTE